jgi:hypothetical protein
MSISPVNEIGQIENDKPDDLFICSTSFEERCTNAVQRLNDNYTARRCLIVRYLAEDQDGLREKHHSIICNNLYHHIENKKELTTKFFDKYDPYSSWDSLKDYCKDFKSLERITIDITTFTKAYLLNLLGYLRDRYPKAKFRIVYTKGIYSENEPLTWGVKNITILPHYGRKWRDKKNSVLVLFLGYEDDRAYGIKEYIDPFKTIAVIADPPTYMGADKPSKVFNAAILNDPEKIKINFSAMDPFETKNKLSELYKSKEHEALGFFISPLGTKMQVVGVYLFFEEEINPNLGAARAQIVYSLPAKYNEKKYTVNYEEKQVWEFYMEPKEIYRDGGG